jgi:hypothetical protein
MKKDTFRVPEWSLNALVNGSYDNLTTNDIFRLETFVNTECITGFLSVENEPYFSHRNDVDSIGGIVYDISCSIEMEYAQ